MTELYAYSHPFNSQTDYADHRVVRDLDFAEQTTFLNGQLPCIMEALSESACLPAFLHLGKHPIDSTATPCSLIDFELLSLVVEISVAHALAFF